MRDRAEQESDGQFYPVAMAAEIICSRWTALVLREMLCGSTRFNDLRRGVPRMSPTLLSKRLKELEEAGVIEVRKTGRAGVSKYKITRKPARTCATSFCRSVSGVSAGSNPRCRSRNLDSSLLMWDMRRNLAPPAAPDRRCTVKFDYPELSAGRKTWWLVIEGKDVDLCGVDPGHDVDLYVRSSLRSMTSVWMGFSTLKTEIDAGRIQLTGDKTVARSMHQWLGLSPFAKEKSRVAS